MNPYEYLTYGERIQRIGQLLAKGITLLLLEEAEQRRRGIPISGGETKPEIADETERAIFDYLTRVRSASPRDIMHGLQLRKSTVFRKLARLTAANLVERLGKTSATRYCVAPRGSNPIPEQSNGGS